MQSEWSEFKTFVDARNLSIQWVTYRNNYYLKAIDGLFEIECSIPTDRDACQDTVDFEDNYKSNGNRTPKQEITTQFEKNDKALKCVSSKATIDETGWATILIKIPGTFAGLDPSSAGRVISGGQGWFDEKHIDDRLVELEVVDIDNVLGLGTNITLKNYCDDEAEDNEGWYVPFHNGIVEITPIGGYGFIASGLYLRIKAKKGGNITTGTFYANIKWGQLD